LVRIVGPAFELVCGWAARGVPLRVACHGIDRYVERQRQKGPRRRPIRIEHCEADVLDVFDDWRRATGVGLHQEPEEPGNGSQRRTASLPAHLERTIARLTAVSARRDDAAPVATKASDAVRELDLGRHHAKSLRGDARVKILERLRALDDELVAVARGHLSSDERGQLHAQAARELAAFRDRMSADAYDGALRSLVDRLVRERYHLPVVSFE
jgi:hypothetical protein